MSILVTGHKGFIGRHLVKALERRGRAFEVFEGDVSASLDCRGIEVVLHLAGRMGNSVSADGCDLCRDNCLGTLKVAEFCAKESVKMIMASTAGVYGRREGNCACRETDPCLPQTPYAISKAVGEGVCRAFSSGERMKLCVLRLFNVYGGGQKTDFLIPYVIKCAIRNQPVSLRSPRAVRDFVHVDDVVEGFLAALDSTDAAEGVFNIGTGVGSVVRDVVLQISELLGRELPIERRPGDTSIADCSIADVALAKARLGWCPRIDLEDGLARTIAAYSKALE